MLKNVFKKNVKNVKNVLKIFLNFLKMFWKCFKNVFLSKCFLSFVLQSNRYSNPLWYRRTHGMVPAQCAFRSRGSSKVRLTRAGLISHWHVVQRWNLAIHGVKVSSTDFRVETGVDYSRLFSSSWSFQDMGIFDEFLSFLLLFLVPSKEIDWKVATNGKEFCLRNGKTSFSQKQVRTQYIANTPGWPGPSKKEAPIHPELKCVSFSLFLNGTYTPKQVFPKSKSAPSTLQTHRGDPDLRKKKPLYIPNWSVYPFRYF